MDKQNVIFNFIEQFQELNVGGRLATDMSYWFARILQERFQEDAPVIVCDVLDNRFGCEINGVVYNINGSVTHEYDWESWESAAVNTPTWVRQIYRDYIQRIPTE
jgi:hypothetical protein